MPDAGATSQDAIHLHQMGDGARRHADLSESFASIQMAMTNATAPLICFSVTGRTVLVNQAYKAATGFGLQDIPDIRACLQTLRRLAGQELDEAVKDWLSAKRRPFSKDATVWTAWNERRIWTIHTSDPILWPDGQTIVLQWMFDVTEQRRLEEVLRRKESETRSRLTELEGLYLSAPLGLCMLDRNLRYTRVNDALARAHGLAKEDHIGRSVFDVVPRVREQVEPVLQGVLETGAQVRDLELRIETTGAPGVIRDWLVHYYPVEDHLGDTLGVGVICEDVTERKKVESELASANVALRRTLDLLFLALRTAGVSVFTQDRDLRYIWIGGDYFGCDPDSSAGKDDAALLPSELVEPMIALKRRVLETGAPASADMPYQRDGKTRWCNLHIEPWRSHNGVVQSLLGAVSDVSERKASEQHVRNLLSELAHRSKNLLTVIQVMARRSVSHGLSSTDFVDSFIERLSGLAQSHDLLAREDWRGISMHELVTSQIGHLRNDVANRLVVEGPDIVLTPVAAQNLGMAIHELSTNAVKYGALSTAGGQVRINWSVFQDDAGQNRMRLSWTERGGPTVKEPTRRGFGRFVIEAIAARALSGSVDLRFDPDGVACIIEGAADSSVIADPAAISARAV